MAANKRSSKHAAKPAAPKTQPRGRTRQGRPRLQDIDDKRSAIISATRELMKTQKPANITREAVARTAGVDPALIRYYFGDKGALFREVVWQTTDELHRKLAAVQEAPGTTIERLRARLHVWLDVFVSNPHYSELVVENVFYGGLPESEEMLKTFVQRAFPDVERLVSEGVASGEIRAVEPRFVYLTLIGLAEYYATAAPLIAELFGTPDAPREQAQAYGRYAADLMIDGLRQRSLT
jgi:AcrR family transcriptional regulator